LKKKISEKTLKREICNVMRVLFERRLISSVGGNASARLPGAEEFWITPRGLFKTELKPKDLIKVNLQGRTVKGAGQPSHETLLHAAIYRRRADVNAVVHAHNPLTVGLTLTGGELKPLTVETGLHLRKTRMIPYVFPGTRRLAELAAERLEKAEAVILQNHGVVGVGRSLSEARMRVEILEEAAAIQLVAVLLKKKLPTIPLRDLEKAESQTA
jgi:ribulose-5-phosphate 4-epimerase/fuculose-1-phosphate aldolase